MIKGILVGLMLLASPALAATHAGRHGSGTLILSDYQFHNAQPYGAFMAPWCKGSLVLGTGYSEAITLSLGKSIFPVVMRWSWPLPPSSCGGVYGFNAIDYGEYDSTPLRIPSKQIKNISTLSEYFEASIKGDTQYFNVIDDLFLTSSPDNDNAHLFEIEIFHHSSSLAVSYLHGLTPVGSYRANGMTWYIARDNSATPPDILIMPTNKADVLSGALDIKGLLDYLTSIGVFTGNEYFNGLGFGIETGGVGTFTITAFSVTYN